MTAAGLSSAKTEILQMFGYCQDTSGWRGSWVCLCREFGERSMKPIRGCASHCAFVPFLKAPIPNTRAMDSEDSPACTRSRLLFFQVALKEHPESKVLGESLPG